MRVITMVGTSLITNVEKDFGLGLDRAERKSLEENPAQHWSAFKDNAILRAKNNLVKGMAAMTDPSAEISSLRLIHKQQNQPLEVALLASDTLISCLIAEILSDYLNEQSGITASFERETDAIAGLRVDDPARFEQQAVPALIDRLNAECENCGGKLIINMTGGYKILAPVLTIYSQLYENVECYYQFEKAEELLTIPQLPIQFDFKLVEEYYTAFERAASDNPEKRLTREELLQCLDDDAKHAEAAFDKLLGNALFFQDGDKYGLTTYGDLLFSRFEQLPKNYNTAFGSLVELRLFHFFKKQYECARWSVNFMLHTNGTEEKAGDADILIEYPEKKEITVIEVKPGWSDPHKKLRTQKIGKLLPAIIDHYPQHKINFHIIVYRTRPVPKFRHKKMAEISRLALELGLNKVKWFWLHSEKDAVTPIKESMIKPINLTQEV